MTQARAGFLPQANIGSACAYNSPLNNGEFSYLVLNGVHEYSSLASVGIGLDASGRLRAQMARMGYQPTGLPLFCSSSHFCNGAK